MLPLSIHPSAAADIKALGAKAIAATGQERRDLKICLARILAVIDQMKSDSNFQYRLLIHGDEADGVNINKWIAQHSLGRDLWRVKLWAEGKLVHYRIIYAFQKASVNTSATYHVLAVVSRDEFNYEHESESEISARIIYDYRNL